MEVLPTSGCDSRHLHHFQSLDENLGFFIVNKFMKSLDKFNSMYKKLIDEQSEEAPSISEKTELMKNEDTDWLSAHGFKANQSNNESGTAWSKTQGKFSLNVILNQTPDKTEVSGLLKYAGAKIDRIQGANGAEEVVSKLIESARQLAEDAKKLC